MEDSLTPYFSTEIYEEAAKELAEKNNIVEIGISETNIVIERVGDSAFVNVWGITDDGNRIFIGNTVDWESRDNNISIAFCGRILAVAEGTTTVFVSYGGHSSTINVEVKRSEIPAFDDLAPLAPLRNEILARGKEMIEFKWTAKKDLKGWMHKHIFKAGSIVTGIPYSQTDYQRGLEGFQKALGFTDFYDIYNVRSTYMPKYGNDCSGFVSFCWNIARNTTASFKTGIINNAFAKVGRYNPNNRNNSDLLSSYKLLQAGDALVTEGHTFLVFSNNVGKEVFCYEQTPYYCVKTIWTYERLISQGKYMPFKMKTM